MQGKEADISKEWLILVIRPLSLATCSFIVYHQFESTKYANCYYLSIWLSHDFYLIPPQTPTHRLQNYNFFLIFPLAQTLKPRSISTSSVQAILVLITCMSPPYLRMERTTPIDYQSFGNCLLLCQLFQRNWSKGYNLKSCHTLKKL